MKKRRDFVKQSAMGTAGIAFGGIGLGAKAYRSFIGSNETINVAVIGIRNRGKDHYRALSKVSNVNIAAICDIDQRLIPEAATGN